MAAQLISDSSRLPETPRMNTRDLVMVTVAGQAAHPVTRSSPYRIGNDGVPRILPGSGGIVLNHRIGDRCVGLAGDHVEPGVALHNNQKEIVGQKNGPNLALLTYACVGNRASVVSGPCMGRTGIVFGKHGGVQHVLVDFAPAILRRLRIGDRIQVEAVGLGLQLKDHPHISVFNAAPRLIAQWGLRSRPPVLHVPVTHLVPAAVMGSGLGRNSTVQGDYDIQLFDAEVRRRFGLNTLRFGDFVAIVHADHGFGRSYQRGWITIGVVVHGDSTVSGHGPGVVTLLTGPARVLRPMRDPMANLAEVFHLRPAAQAVPYRPLVNRPLAGKNGIAGRISGYAPRTAAVSGGKIPSQAPNRR